MSFDYRPMPSEDEQQVMSLLVWSGAYAILALVAGIAGWAMVFMGKFLAAGLLFILGVVALRESNKRKREAVKYEKN